MRFGFFSIVLFLVLSLSSCQHLYYYSLPDAEVKKRFPPEQMKWEYTDNQVTKITVIGDDNKLYRLDVTPKTKIEATTVYGEVYTFYLQKIKVEDADAIIGAGSSWTGYELHDHAERTIYTRDIKTLRILSETKASDITL